MPYIVVIVVDKKNKLIDWLYIVDYFLSRIFHSLRDTNIAFEGLQSQGPLLDDYNLWAGRDHHHTISVMTRDLGLQVSSEGPPRLVASYD